MNADETLIHKEEGRLWRIEMVRGTIPLPGHHGVRWKCWIVRWSSPEGGREFSSDQVWAAQRFFENTRDQLLEKWGGRMKSETIYSESSEFYRVELIRHRSELPEGMLPRTAVSYSVLVEDSGDAISPFVHVEKRKRAAEEFFRNEVGRLRRKYGIGEDA